MRGRGTSCHQRVPATISPQTSTVFLHSPSPSLPVHIVTFKRTNSHKLQTTPKRLPPFPVWIATFKRTKQTRHTQTPIAQNIQTNHSLKTVREGQRAGRPASLRTHSSYWSACKSGPVLKQPGGCAAQTQGEYCEILTGGKPSNLKCRRKRETAHRIGIPVKGCGGVNWGWSDRGSKVHRLDW